MINSEKIRALAQDAVFNQELAIVQSPKELQNLFAKYNIEITDKEMHELMAQATKANTNEELGEMDLENVSGGCLGCVIAKWLIKVLS